MRLHLDTDFAGDIDDACALAMLLGSDVEIVGITTTADPDGRRAGYVARFLELVGRNEIAVASGAAVAITTDAPMGSLPDHDRYWPEMPAPSTSSSLAAIDLLDHSIERGATIAAIGPFTNLAMLEAARPGRLRQVPVVAMGGWVDPPAPGLPEWGPAMDWNVQCDTHAAEALIAAAEVTLVTLPSTLRAHLRAAHLPRLAASGPLGRLLAHQAVVHERDQAMGELGRANTELPDDLLNFLYDPVACAVALGWRGAVIERARVRPVREGEVLFFRRDDDGQQVRLVVDVDGRALTELWLNAVERAQRSG